MLTTIEFDNLGALDGGAARKCANTEIRRAIDDLLERGHEDGKARIVKFQLEIYLDHGKVIAHLGAHAPLLPRRTSGTSCQEKTRGGETVLVFRDDNPDNVDQPLLSDFDKVEVTT